MSKGLENLLFVVLVLSSITVPVLISRRGPSAVLTADGTYQTCEWPTKSYGSVGSTASIGSVGSLWSIGSVGSILSIGSVGSVLSVGSFGSAGSILALLGALSFGGFLSVGQRRAPFGLGRLCRKRRAS